MTESQFWQLIDESKSKSFDVISEQADYLEDVLSNASLEDLYHFDQICIQLYKKTYQKKIWSLALVLNGACDSEEDFRAFSGWLISRGKQIFEQVLENPDLIHSEINEEGVEAEFEELFYIAQNAYEIKKDVQKMDYFERYRSWNEVDIFWDDEFWEEEHINDDDLIKLFPLTTKKLGWE